MSRLKSNWQVNAADSAETKSLKQALADIVKDIDAKASRSVVQKLERNKSDLHLNEIDEIPTPRKTKTIRELIDNLAETSPEKIDLVIRIARLVSFLHPKILYHLFKEELTKEIIRNKNGKNISYPCSDHLLPLWDHVPYWHLAAL